MAFQFILKRHYAFTHAINAYLCIKLYFLHKAIDFLYNEVHNYRHSLLLMVVIHYLRIWRNYLMEYGITCLLPPIICDCTGTEDQTDSAIPVYCCMGWCNNYQRMESDRRIHRYYQRIYDSVYRKRIQRRSSGSGYYGWRICLHVEDYRSR